MRGPPAHPTQRRVGFGGDGSGAAQLDETLQTLRYAENAKLVKNRPRRYVLRRASDSSACRMRVRRGLLRLVSATAECVGTDEAVKGTAVTCVLVRVGTQQLGLG